jgi:hypothetical protein
MLCRVCKAEGRACCVVVEDQVHLELGRHGLLEEVEELAELDRAVAAVPTVWAALVSH